MGEQSLCHMTNNRSTKGYVLRSLALAVKQKHFKVILDLYSITFDGWVELQLIQQFKKLISFFVFVCFLSIVFIDFQKERKKELDNIPV